MTIPLSRIDKIKREFTILKKEHFVAALDGTHHKVFISNRYVIRFRDNNPKLLMREIYLLKRLDHPLIPKILWRGRIDKSIAAVENRLPGKTINVVWKTLSKSDQKNIIKQIVQFLQYLKTQTRENIYSVNTGKKYENFSYFLTDSIKQKTARIKKNKQANKILCNLLPIIEKKGIRNLFADKKNNALVHGDLIIHNLLTNGKNLTGVLDWELALFGDSDYDLFRLFYYQECAKAYQEQGTDKTFEANFLDKLITAILKSGLIKNKKLFQKKYKFARAAFFLNTLDWAVNSGDPKNNINELIILWNKKRG